MPVCTTSMVRSVASRTPARAVSAGSDVAVCLRPNPHPVSSGTGGAVENARAGSGKQIGCPGCGCDALDGELVKTIGGEEHREVRALEAEAGKMALKLRERACERRVNPHLVPFRSAKVPDRVVAVALVEDEDVGFCAAVEIVEAGAAANRVCPGLTQEGVVVCPAGDRVVAQPALRVVVPGIAVDHVVAVEAP